MAAFLDGCRFTPTLGGTTDWTYSSAVTGYQGPALAGIVNGTLYKYRAESADLSQWELGEGAYNTSTGVLARTTVLFNSSGTGTAVGQSGAGSKINCSTVPQVAVVALAEDLLAVQQAWTTFTPTITATSGTFTTVSGAGSYVQIGKIVSFICSITITTVGTAAGNCIMTLPVGTLKRTFAGAGVETAVVGSGLSYYGSAGASTIAVRKYDSTAMIGAGYVLVVSGTYEAA